MLERGGVSSRSTLGVWGRMGCMCLYYPTHGGGYASCLGLVVVLSLYRRIVLAFVPQSFFVPQSAGDLLGVSVFFKKNDEKK